MFSPKGAALERGWPGRIDGDRVVQLAAQTLQAFFTGGGGAREHAEYPLAEVDFRAPVLYPPSVRLFTGSTLDFAFGNPASIYGPEDEIPYPEGGGGLDYGVGIAAVIGADGAIGGYTLANPWLAPNLPGAKQRDFALSIGPVVVTELDQRTIRSAVAGDEVVAETTFSEPKWDELVARAALNTRLRPGDLLVADFGPGGADLKRDDVVKLEVEGIGVLRNRVGAGSAGARSSS
jgi:2-keto-4-pentenoate hydratase/2-oxohepta-3-ene-1,7-dioic acid hydratase in catechol pathway